MPIDVNEFKSLQEGKGSKAKGVPQEQVIEMLRNEALTTKEVAEKLGISYSAAFSRLNRLMEKGLIEARHDEKGLTYWGAV